MATSVNHVKTTTAPSHIAIAETKTIDTGKRVKGGTVKKAGDRAEVLTVMIATALSRADLVGVGVGMGDGVEMVPIIVVELNL